ncbi:unnamed protein product [Bacillus velezensis]|nr:unnamed protein product [Bacillus velezensis]
MGTKDGFCDDDERIIGFLRRKCEIIITVYIMTRKDGSTWQKA